MNLITYFLIVVTYYSEIHIFKSQKNDRVNIHGQKISLINQQRIDYDLNLDLAECGFRMEKVL